jgi:hypothetical protein
MEISTTSMESSIKITQKDKDIDLPYDPVIPVMGIYPKECKSGHNGDSCTSMFITALFTIAKLLKQLRCPATEDGSRKCGIYTKWSFVQPEGIMTCGLKVNGCNLRISC